MTTFPRTNFIGFERIFDELDKLASHANDSYPPHNIIKLNDKSYVIEMAVAGFTRDDLKIDLKDNILYVKGERKPRYTTNQYVHRGISTRSFSKSFRLSEYVEVDGASLKEGILSVVLIVKVPEEETPKSIKISV
jgi:molecular chaperone IbpA